LAGKQPLPPLPPTPTLGKHQPPQSQKPTLTPKNPPPQLFLDEPCMLDVIGSISATYEAGIEVTLPFKNNKTYQAEKAFISFCFPKKTTHTRDTANWCKATAAILAHDEIVLNDFPQQPKPSKKVPINILRSLGGF
jgi:hypothetical protein